MKETEQFHSDKIEILKETSLKKTTQYLGSVRPHAGHICFEFNTKTGEIAQAQFEENKVFYSTTGKYLLKRKVVIKEDCVYITALNQKNAIKKFINMKKPQKAHIDKTNYTEAKP